MGDSLLGTWIWRRDKFGSNEAVSGVLQQDALGHIGKIHMGVSPKIRVHQHRPQNTIVLVLGTPQKVPLILGNPNMCNSCKRTLWTGLS